MIDVDELQKAVQKGFISKELATKAIEKAEGVL
jgi:predicted RNA-binding protein associated with RNAse of E/G family